jgi:hypothetical protein
MNGSILNGRDKLLTENGPPRRAEFLILCFISKGYFLYLAGIIFASILDEAIKKTREATCNYVL